MDYTKQCWYCGEVTMVDKGDYYQCSSCGTTWNEQPVPGYFMDIKPVKDICHGGTHYAPGRGTRLKKPRKTE